MMKKSGAATKIRTRDPLITNQMLYQLSYSGLSHYKQTIKLNKFVEIKPFLPQILTILCTSGVLFYNIWRSFNLKQLRRQPN